jgi:hypothetical protein
MKGTNYEAPDSVLSTFLLFRLFDSDILQSLVFIIDSDFNLIMSVIHLFLLEAISFNVALFNQHI